MSEQTAIALLLTASFPMFCAPVPYGFYVTKHITKEPNPSLSINTLLGRIRDSKR